MRISNNCNEAYSHESLNLFFNKMSKHKKISLNERNTRVSWSLNCESSISINNTRYIEKNSYIKLIVNAMLIVMFSEERTNSCLFIMIDFLKHFSRSFYIISLLINNLTIDETSCYDTHHFLALSIFHSCTY